MFWSMITSLNHEDTQMFYVCLYTSVCHCYIDVDLRCFLGYFSRSIILLWASLCSSQGFHVHDCYYGIQSVVCSMPFSWLVSFDSLLSHIFLVNVINSTLLSLVM